MVNETESAVTESSAALRTMKVVAATMSRLTATDPAKRCEMRSGLSLMSYRLGTANFGRRGCPLNWSILSFFCCQMSLRNSRLYDDAGSEN